MEETNLLYNIKIMGENIREQPRNKRSGTCYYYSKYSSNNHQRLKQHSSLFHSLYHLDRTKIPSTY